MGIWYERSLGDKVELFRPSFLDNTKFVASSVAGNLCTGVHKGHVEISGNKKSKLLISIDGKINNLHKLSLDYGLKTEDNDLDILQELYFQNGYQGLLLLRGEASIVLYDVEKNITYLYRCFLRGLPLYFGNKNNKLTVCTNPVYILHRNDISDTINQNEIVNILTGNPLKFKDSVFDEIDALAHGELVSIDADGITKRMKQPLSDIFLSSYSYVNDREVYKKYRQLLKKAVYEKIKPNKKYGIMLSSGMDSSSIAYYAAKKLQEEGRELIAYSWELPDNKGDESKNIRLLCDQLKIPLKIFNGEMLGPFDYMDNIQVLPDSPFVNPFWKLLEKIYIQAANDGIDFLFTGDYGDFQYRDDRKNLLKDIWYYKRFDIIAEIVKERGVRGVLGELKRQFKSSSSPKKSYTWFKKELLDLLDHEDEPSREKGFEHYVFALTPFAAVNLRRDQYLTSLYNLKRIEPYQDEELIHFTLNIPTYLTFRNNQKKWFAREAMKGRLPEEIRTQPRVGLIGTLIEKSFYRNRKKVEEKIWENRSFWNSYIKEEWMSEKLKEDTEVGNYDLYVIWSCITLSAWKKAIRPGGSLYEGEGIMYEKKVEGDL